MLIKINKQTRLETTIELQLPAYFQHHAFLFMITENETVFQVTEESQTSAFIMSWTKENPFHKDHVAQAIEGEPISKEVFLKSWDKAIECFEGAIKLRHELNMKLANDPTTAY